VRPGEPDRERAFWFLFTGFAWLILGALIDRLEVGRETLPTFQAPPATIRSLTAKAPCA
jgi:hypothetical protein